MLLKENYCLFEREGRSRGGGRGERELLSAIAKTGPGQSSSQEGAHPDLPSE